MKETIITLSNERNIFIVSNCQSGYIELFLEKTGLGEYVKDIECFGNTGKQKNENIRILMERNGLEHAGLCGDILETVKRQRRQEFHLSLLNMGLEM